LGSCSQLQEPHPTLGPSGLDTHNLTHNSTSPYPLADGEGAASAVNSPSGVWGGSRTVIEFGAFQQMTDIDDWLI